MGDDELAEATGIPGRKDPTVTVAVDAVIQRAVIQLARAIYGDHNMQIRKVTLDWREIEGVGAYPIRAEVTTVANIDRTARPGLKESEPDTGVEPTEFDTVSNADNP